MPILINNARADATLNSAPVYDLSSVEVTIPAIKIDKTTDAIDGIWAGDILTYSIEISNLDETSSVTGISLTDKIDIGLAKLVEDSVKVGNTQLVIGEEFTYNNTTGDLVIPNPDGDYNMPDVDPGDSYTVTFQVTKV